MEPITCTHCSAELSPRQVTAVTRVVAGCPHCRAVLSEHYLVPAPPEPERAAVLEDLARIDDWLARERAAAPALAAREVPAPDAAGVRGWAVTGSTTEAAPAGWAVEVFYSDRSPGFCAVRAVRAEPGDVRPEVRRLAPVFADHGLQMFDVYRFQMGFDLPGWLESGAAAFEMGLPVPEPEPVPPETTRWGPMLLLSTHDLPTGLLRGAAARLLRAAKDATVARTRAAA